MLSTAIAVAISTVVGIAQAPRISPSDVRAIASAVIEDVVPDSGKLGARPVKGRQLYFDASAFLTALQKVANGQLPEGLGLARPFVNARAADVTHCHGGQRSPASCQVENDGITLTVQDAAFDPSTGQLRIRVAVEWNYNGYGLSQTNGYVVDLFLAKNGSGWKVVRHSSYAAG
jgi:hypothetical protein